MPFFINKKGKKAAFENQKHCHLSGMLATLKRIWLNEKKNMQEK